MADREQSALPGERRAGGTALAAIVVTHDSAATIVATLERLRAVLRPGDELIVCDNASRDRTAAIVRERAPEATLLEAGSNLGFGAACNLAAARARADLLLFLNPDTVPGEGFRDAIERPLRDGRGWAAWQGLVTDAGGATLNSHGGVVHFTGIAWAGGAGEPRSAAPAEPREITFPSGACLAIRRAAWEELGGFSAPYFLYHEDADLGLRLWLAGHRVGIEPGAVCDHEYEFVKGGHKWRYLERNRWATVLRCWPGRLLVPLLPALLALELVLLAVAARGGWLGEKLRADAEGLARLPRTLRERRAIQAGASIGAARFAALLTPEVSSRYLGAAARSPLLRRLLAAYWRAVLRLL